MTSNGRDRDGRQDFPPPFPEHFANPPPRWGRGSDPSPPPFFDHTLFSSVRWSSPHDLEHMKITHRDRARSAMSGGVGRAGEGERAAPDRKVHTGRSALASFLV